MKCLMPLVLIAFVLPCKAQTVESAVAVLPIPTSLDCSKEAEKSSHVVITKPPQGKGDVIQRIIRWFEDDVLDKNKGTIKLGDAISAVQSAVNSAKCANYDPNGRFQLISADMDFQQEKDEDGNLEVLFIGGVAGEKEKQTILDTDFTYTVPIVVNLDTTHSEKLMSLHIVAGAAKAQDAKPNEVSAATSDPKDLGVAIAAAIAQLNTNVTGLPTLSQHQVKVSLKFVFTVDGTLELEPKIGSVGVTAKYKHTAIATQNLTLTFADSAPAVSLAFTPTPSLVGKPIALTVTAVSAVNPTRHVSGTVNFIVDGDVYKTGGAPLVAHLVNGISTDGAITFAAPGTHVISAFLQPSSGLDAAMSTPVVVAVQ
jgi:hypothetical protein